MRPGAFGVRSRVCGRPQIGKRVPTCHRTLTHSVTANESFQSACRNADSESRIFYEEEAETLGALQKRVLNASVKEEPCDVFICYKGTDVDGERTAGSVLAQGIYDALTANGPIVFFVRISLEDKLGADYEPCIFAELNSAKVMLMVTPDTEHCNSVWVKVEKLLGKTHGTASSMTKEEKGHIASVEKGPKRTKVLLLDFCMLRFWLLPPFS